MSSVVEIPVLTTPDTSGVETRLLSAENQFRLACCQIIQINQKLNGLTFRYRSARARNARAHRYQLRLRLAVVEGVRNMFYDYAEQKADDIYRLRYLILGGPMEALDASDGDA